ncbi:hypothetical protein CC85DRAFT_197864 [Cutaneotrichosporon oleaginosum]|uniref:Uncharacterized protein n=1 Tax=Cutaneotrichosporon oleaginosum TaxID=879819 RepID=A0A0J0XE26_9TREE|nr:uncharacterized protein CC85DRAFT_197864 [Cutaneotrichosporon oleaginosum]KLT39332.1 hypothetical protein CC85DRAFT_197864 [Cutaneotrichosporon oleaginosum]TXT08528.1 hypothetical protein COLE_05452 [Cutaneotrichosporon oleaginosum]
MSKSGGPRRKRHFKVPWTRNIGLESPRDPPAPSRDASGRSGGVANGYASVDEVALSRPARHWHNVPRWLERGRAENSGPARRRHQRHPPRCKRARPRPPIVTPRTNVKSNSAEVTLRQTRAHEQARGWQRREWRHGSVMPPLAMDEQEAAASDPSSVISGACEPCGRRAGSPFPLADEFRVSTPVRQSLPVTVVQL